MRWRSDWEQDGKAECRKSHCTCSPLLGITLRAVAPGCAPSLRNIWPHQSQELRPLRTSRLLVARPAAQRNVRVMAFRDLRRHVSGRLGKREISHLRAEARDQEIGHDALEPCPSFLGFVSHGRPAVRVLPTAPVHETCNGRLSLALIISSVLAILTGITITTIIPASS